MSLEIAIDRLETEIEKQIDLVHLLMHENASLKAQLEFMRQTVNEKIGQNCGFFCALSECPKSMERYEEQKPVGEGLGSPS